MLEHLCCREITVLSPRAVLLYSYIGVAKFASLEQPLFLVPGMQTQCCKEEIIAQIKSLEAFLQLGGWQLLLLAC